jgi:hypothetical protein
MKINLIHIWKNKGKIAEGVANSIFKKEHIEEIANERLQTCMSCEHIDKTGSKCAVPGTQPCCALCGCSLAFKTRSLSSKCDIDNWSAAVTQEEEDLIKQNLK